MLGRTVRQLGFEAKYGVSVTRLQRGGVEMMATSDVQLQFGDVLVIVGDAATLEQVAAELGNSPKQLNETNFIPVFFGIVLGIIAGSLPIALPGLPVAVRLGLAGGPLVIAILLARVGNIGQLVWYMPGNVNYAFRELGIILFLACVGLKAGSQFVSTLLSPSGLLWLVCGAMITIVPVLAAGLFGRAILKLNYMTILGLQAGSMTTPALAFANTIVGSHAPAISYASVYPRPCFFASLSRRFSSSFCRLIGIVPVGTPSSEGSDRSVRSTEDVRRATSFCYYFKASADFTRPLPPGFIWRSEVRLKVTCDGAERFPPCSNNSRNSARRYRHLALLQKARFGSHAPWSIHFEFVIDQVVKMIASPLRAEPDSEKESRMENGRRRRQ